MNKRTDDYELCYQCGWLGLCVIACPLADPAKAIRPDSSTHPDLQNPNPDEAFEITVSDHDASRSSAGKRPADAPA